MDGFDMDDAFDIEIIKALYDVNELQAFVIEMRQNDIDSILKQINSEKDKDKLYNGVHKTQYDVASMALDVVFGKYFSVVKSVLKCFEGENRGEDVFEYLRLRVESYLLEDGDDDIAVSFRSMSLLLCASSLLLLYQQSNWTGPTLEESEMESIDSLFHFVADSSTLKEKSVTILGSKALQDEDVTNQCTYPHLLLVSLGILTALTQSGSSLKSLPLWYGRSLTAWQQTLTAKAPSVYVKELMLLAYKQASNNYSGSGVLPSRVLLEYGLALQTLEDYDGARALFVKAHVASGLDLFLTGAIAKRTKFQKEGYANMVMEARSIHEEIGVPESIVKVDEDVRKNKGTVVVEGENEASTSTGAFEGMKEISLGQCDPETYLLEEKRFLTSQNGQGVLSRIDQAILLSYCIDLRKNRPKDCLTDEEMIAHTERVQKQPRNWMIHSTSLLLQCWVEFESYKKAERAVLQLEALVDQHTNQLTKTQFSTKAIENSAPNYERLQYIHCLPFPPRWKLRAELGKRLAKLGILRSAAEIFLSLEMWDEVVDCYTVLEDRKNGIALVKERLAIKETPKLLVSLGDLTGEVSNFTRAWEISSHRYWPAAQRLARVKFNDKDYEGCIEYLNQATKINPLTESLWFLMGSAAMRAGTAFLEVARIAFNRVVNIEPENGKAWGNLSAVLIHLGKAPEAFSATKEAIKHEPENWRMWDNLLTLSLTVKDYAYGIMCFNRLLDIQDKEYKLCSKTLDKLVRGIVNRDFAVEKITDGDEIVDEIIEVGDIDDSFESDSRSPPPIKESIEENHFTSYAEAVEGAKKAKGKYLEKRIVELLGRVTSKILTSSDIWNTYAFLHHSLGNLDKAIDCKLRECRARKVDGWDSDVEKFQKLSIVSVELCELLLEEGSKRSIKDGLMWINSILKRSVDTFGDKEDYIKLSHVQNTLLEKQ